MVKVLSRMMVGFLWIVGSLGVHAQSSFWHQTNGPSGGLAYAFAAAPQGEVYALVSGGFKASELFRSDDDGATWTALPSPDGYIRTLEARPSGRLYMSAGDTLYFSDDRGQGWQFSIVGARIQALAFGPSERLFVGTEQGVYRADGAAWQPAGLDSVAVLGMLYTSADALVAVSRRYVFRSDDDGATWRHLATFEQPNQIYGAALIEHPGGDVYIGTEGTAHPLDIPGPGVFRLTASDSLTRAGLDLVSINVLAIDENGHLVAAASGINVNGTLIRPVGVHISPDEGRTWIPKGLVNTPVPALVVTPQGTLVAGTSGLASEGGVKLGRGLVRAPGGSDYAWEHTGQGIPHAEAYTLATGAGLLCAAADYSVFCSEDRGDNWSLVYTFPLDQDGHTPFYTGLAIHPTGDIFMGQWSGLLLRSQDRGETWSELLPPGPRVGSPRRHFDGKLPYYRQHLMIAPGGTVLVADDDTIWRSTDRGDSWTTVSPLPGVPVTALAAAPGGRLFALAQTPRRDREPHEVSFFTSDDDGLTWTKQAMLTPFRLPLHVVAKDAATVFIAADQWIGEYSEPRFFHVKEDGGGWTVDVVSEPPLVHDMVIDGEGRLYAASGGMIDEDAPVLLSLDEGRTWQPLVDEVLPEGVFAWGAAVAIDADGYLYAGTGNNGVFRSIAVVGTAAEAEAEIPAGLMLEAGYPNPFTRAVTIPFALERPAHVSLAVYDLLGRRVATLVEEEEKPAGRHEIRWEATGRPAGVYVYKLIADGAVKAGRMVLVK